MAPAPDVYIAPVPEVEHITPVRAVTAALAFVVEYIATEPALSDVAPASTVYAAPMPVVEHIAPELVVLATPAPVVEHIVSASAVSCVAPAPVVHAAHAPIVEHIAPAAAAAWQRPLGSNRLSILISSH